MSGAAKEESTEAVISDSIQQNEADSTLSSRKNESIQTTGPRDRSGSATAEIDDEGVSRNQTEELRTARLMICLINGLLFHF